jgi:putative ABC transport system substrate-binding protein
VVKCQSDLVWWALRSCSQAAISLMRVCLSGMRRSRHWAERTPSSDSARSSQLPCLGVLVPFEALDQPPRFGRREGFVEGRLAVDIEVVLEQHVRKKPPTKPKLDPFISGDRRQAPALDALRAGLVEAGFEEGRNLTIEYRFGIGDSRRLSALAADLVNRQVAAIVAIGAQAPIQAAKAATSTIPIVFLYAGDPVDDGLIASLNRPGGNVTGMTTLDSDLAGKRLDLLHKMVPQATTVGFLSGTPNYITYEEQTSSMRAAAGALGLELAIVECRSDQDFEAAFSTFEERRAEALIMGTFPFGNRNKVVELAERHKIPAIYPGRGFAVDGGLMSYGTDGLAAYRQVGAHYVGRILKGAKPADLPVQQPTKFELVINLKTAKALGLTVPQTLLVVADDIIE